MLQNEMVIQEREEEEGQTTAYEYGTNWLQLEEEAEWRRLPSCAQDQVAPAERAGAARLREMWPYRIPQLWLKDCAPRVAST